MIENRDIIVSVVLPVYNGEKFLDESLSSILAQTESRFELLVVDDSSTDRSSDIVTRWMMQDARIRLIRSPKKGVAAACNEGIRLAQGRYIARMDADDIALHDRFAKQVRYLEQHGNCVAVGGAYVEFFNDGSRGRTQTWPARWTYNLDDLFGPIGMPHPTAMIKIEALKSVGGYRGAFVSAQDVDLWLRLASEGHIDNLNDVVLLYRRHSEQISERRAIEQSLCRGVAMAMSIARHIDSEPKWDADEPLSALSVSKVAANSSPELAALLYAVLVEYYFKLGDATSSRYYANLSYRTFRGVVKLKIAQVLLRRWLVFSLSNGEIGLPTKLIMAAPVAWTQSLGEYLFEKFRRRWSS
jgi:glycosyltransferase involved in cell wall biosynthesis